VNQAVETTGDVPASELEFNFRSGRLCLALVATLGERWRREIERLREPEDLGRWYQEAGLLETQIPVTRAGLDAARTLREAIHRQAKRVIDGRPWSVDDEVVLNAAATPADLVPQLRKRDLVLQAPRTSAERAALSSVARDAIDMFTRVDPGRLRECASDECGLLFVDTSRPGRRRWCSSEACGGRARAAEYRRRSASGSG
jgi:predicted RNA-binding Zn ribbon-like protein